MKEQNTMFEGGTYMNMELRKLAMALYNIEDTAWRKRNCGEIVELADVAIKCYDEFKERMKTTNKKGLVELGDVIDYLKEVRDEQMDCVSVLLNGEKAQKEKWVLVENIIEMIEAWFVPIE